MTPVPSWRLTSASNSPAAIWRLLEVHDQLDDVVPLVGGGEQLVDHVLDQEQPPAAGALLPGQLGVEVRDGHLRQRALAPLVGDAYAQAGLVGDHPDADRQLRARVVAMLDGVHGRLADRGLEPLQPRAGQAELGDRLGHPVDRQALVADLAGDVELGQQPLPHRARPALQGDQGDVVLLLPVRAGELRELLQQPVDQRLAASGGLADHGGDPREAEHLAVRAVRLGQAVGVEQDRVAGPEGGLLLLVIHAGHQAERHPGRAQLPDLPAAGRDVGHVVPGVGVAQVAAGRVEHRVQAGREHVRRHLLDQQVVDPGEDLARRHQPGRLGPQDRVGGGHDQRGRHPLVGDVPDHDAEQAVGQLDEVVEVAADLAGRPVKRGQVPAGQLGQVPRQEPLLDELGDPQLLLDALPLADLGLLLADQLGHPHRRGGVAGQVVQQLAVVGGVLRLAAARAEVEQADELALADQRDHQPDAGVAQAGQRRRVELQRADVNRPGGAGEVRDQRVVGGDLDRRHVDQGGPCGERLVRRAGARLPPQHAAQVARDRRHGTSRSSGHGHCAMRPFRDRYGTGPARAILGPVMARGGGEMAGVRLALLCPPRGGRDGVPVTVDTRKAIALLAYLAVAPERHARDTMATLLWPDYDQDHARGALRRTLSTLNKALGEGWLAADRAAVGFARTGFWLDVARFEGLLASCRDHGHPPEDACPACVAPLREAARLYRGDFLAGFALRDSAGFDDWQYYQAERLRRALAGALERLVQAEIGQRRWDEAIDAARRWLALDPLHEAAHRQLMRLYPWSGRRAAALRQYQACVKGLDEELGVEPLEETTGLRAAILADRLPPPGEPAPAPAAATAPSPAPAPAPLVGRV